MCPGTHLTRFRDPRSARPVPAQRSPETAPKKPKRADKNLSKGALPAKIYTSLKTEMMINIDAAGEWADETASRWLTTEPMDGLDAASRPEDIRNGVVRTITETSSAMAEKTRAAGCYPDATPKDCKTWLETCCNQVSGPRRETLAARTAPQMGDAPEPAAKAIPLLRWAGGSREQAQNSEITWTRGRGRGALNFDVLDIDGIQTIVEHGWPADEHDLVNQMTNAIATAARRAADIRKRTSASIATIRQALLDDAQRYAATDDARPPDWWKKTEA